MDADLDTFATALYVRTDDLLKVSLERAPVRPVAGIAPRITDAEVVTLAVMQALLGRTSEARWPAPSCGICSPICPSSRATTSGCAPCPTPCAG